MYQSPFLTVNPISSPVFGVPLVSESAPVFSSGVRYGHGGLALSGGSQGEGIQMEFMFSKMLTLSDVGKLNRLLIPRQDAEKYFPMGLGALDDYVAFEDSTGVLWHFRYSFWQSSKTYVLTKGWMNFVKEKGLGDGDVVSFYQGTDAAGIHHRFIYFKKKNHGLSMPHHVPPAMITPFSTLDDNWLRKALYSSNQYRASLPWQHLPDGSVDTMPPNLPIMQSPLIPQGALLGSGVAPAKKCVRLFGVDLNIDGN
ncbi:hypothetical protein PR202_gb16201 [Eleusine coracana subsp. coracana]|uniref:TF-B3 domain-containing protein n=1 Tax=Eleusine coracana subsp. coracana TaxID=191504 RepID=A0AAV5F0G6_ELECO|nr:hypothetical protein PR202_gb16201 [Eleusine coracana subsp. coracana]